VPIELTVKLDLPPHPRCGAFIDQVFQFQALEPDIEATHLKSKRLFQSYFHTAFIE
jgi:hypothetical protein